MGRSGHLPENLIGVGTFGSVYKVFIDRAQVLVAVKVFNLLHQGSLKSFIAECEVLRSIRHSNILHPTVGTQKVRSAPKNLSFVQRLDIAIDVACALDYLHNHCDTPTVHCDLKPSNILLDNDLTGRVSDFGLARFLSKPNNISTNLPSVIKLRGPVSYVAPEYETGSEASTYGDVYSFGILLLEMFTGKKSTDDMFSYRLNLHKFVSMSYFEGVFSEIADPRLLLQGGNSRPSKCSVKFKSEIGQCLRSIFEIGIVCSSESPRGRMDIHNVVFELNSVRDDFLNRLHSYSPTVGVRSRSCSSCIVCRRRMKEPPAWRSWSNRGYRQYGTGSGERKYWDVYSFGILLLEMFTGKGPTDLMNIHNFVEMAIPERVTEIADSRLLQRGTNDTQKNECLISIFEIGIACSDGAQSDRMSIDRVVPRLHSIRDRLLP
ncbi:putative protein kinase RLK-Pelle-LRR-XII-1 family [Rosa chinensis]|uniref:non-specific serine/threonine protein kinase n=1 Tax=Rosa chinensis TaxID=74649 RepID=A0A2P6SHL4_ROSCH|nr:putative protein kinase RLK-Pelle-LRR-XII-1 family [Rosa chinensis]